MKSEMECASAIDDAFDKIRYKVMTDCSSAVEVLSYLLNDYIKTMEALSDSLTDAEQGDLKLGRQLLALLNPDAYLPLLKVKLDCSHPAALFTTRKQDRSPMKYFMLHLQHRSHLLRADGWLTAIFISFFSLYEEYRSMMNDRLLFLLPVINFWKRDMEVACIELTEAMLNRNVREKGHYIQNRLSLLRHHFPSHLKPIIAEQVANEWMIGLYGVEEMYIHPHYSFVFNWLSASLRKRVIQAAAQTKISPHIRVASVWLKLLTYPERKMLNARLMLEMAGMTDNYGYKKVYPKLTRYLIEPSAMITEAMSVPPDQSLTLPALIALSQLSVHIPVEHQSQVVALIVNHLQDFDGCCEAGFALSLLKLKRWFDNAEQKLDLRTHFLQINTRLRNGPRGTNDPGLYALHDLSLLREMLTPDTIELIVRTLQENIEVHDNEDLVALIEASVKFLKSWGPMFQIIQCNLIYNTLMRFVQIQDGHDNYRNTIKIMLLVDLYNWPDCSTQDRTLISSLIEPRFKIFLAQTSYHASPEWLETIIRINPTWLTYLISVAIQQYELRYCKALDRLSDLFSQNDRQLFIAPLETGIEFHSDSWPIIRKWMTMSQRELIATAKASKVLESVGENYMQAQLSHISQFFNQPTLLDDVTSAVRLKVIFTMSNHVRADKAGDYYEFVFYEHLQTRYNAYTTHEYLRATPINGQRHLLNDLAEKISPIPNKPY